MEQVSYYATAIGIVLVTVLWFLFGAVFLFRKKPETTRDGAKLPISFVGLVLQGVGFIPVWFVGRTPIFSPFFARQFELNIVIQIVAVALAAFSVLFAKSAVGELGRQSSL